MDERLCALRSWIDAVLRIPAFELRAASTDASFRRYFRIIAGPQTYIAMDMPADRYDSQRYTLVAERLHELGLNVPRVLAQDPHRGFFLLTDLGERHYLSQLNGETVERLYGDALAALVVLQAGIYTDSDFLSHYDEHLLMTEMELFRQWYLDRHLGIRLKPQQNAALDEVFEQLADSALAQSEVWVHRDYHSRNLMVMEKNNPGILDFQDAVRGAITYDLVSLLRDCYIAWPRAQVEGWVKGYHTLAAQSGLPVCEDLEQFRQWFDLMGVQRHLKAVGIFARLNHRDAKPGYLGDIPRTLAYVLEVSARYDTLQPLYGLLRELRLPDVTSDEGKT